ncbi:unnamed protein product [Calypogeia fissa]
MPRHSQQLFETSEEGQHLSVSYTCHSDFMVTLRGKAGWALNYNIVEGLKKKKQAKRHTRKTKAQIEDAKDEEDEEDDDAESENPESEDENAESENGSATSTDGSIRRSMREKLDTRNRRRQNKSMEVEVSDDEASGATTSDNAKKSAGSPQLYVQKNREFEHHWADPGTTRRKTYVSKRRPITSAEREGVLEAAKACPITHNSYLRQLEKDNCYRALVLAIPAPWWREDMPQTKKSYKGTLVDEDEEGGSWQMRVRGREIFWRNFSLDHRLEEDDVVVMELVDPRIKSLKFLVHIFRVVDVKMTVRGQAGWAHHFTVVDGIQKEARMHHRKEQSKGRSSNSASGWRLRRKPAVDSEDDSDHSSSAVETSRKRLRRRGRSLASTYRTVDSEDDSDDFQPLQHVRIPKHGGPTHPETHYRSGHGAGSSAGAGPSAKQKAEYKSGKECVVCWDAPAVAARIPCGHLAGCMDCLEAIKAEDWGCPVCRASIERVQRIFD